MKKLFLLLILLFSTSMLFGAYDIKLGVFQNVKNLRANIAKVKPYTFRKQIIVKKRKGFYYTFAIVEGSRSQANKALKAYRTIFKDAFIAGQIKSRKKVRKRLVEKKVHVRKIKKVKKIVKVVSKTIPLKIKTVISTQVTTITDKNQTIEILDAKVLVQNKSVYICYEDGPAHLENRVVQMIFNKDTITYVPLEEKEALEIKYTIDKNMIVLSLTDITMIHKIVENKDTYLIVDSYMGTKKIYTLRYYFNQEDALKFLK